MKDPVLLAEALSDARHGSGRFHHRSYDETFACSQLWGALELALRDCDDVTARKARAAGLKRALMWEEYWTKMFLADARRRGQYPFT